MTRRNLASKKTILDHVEELKTRVYVYLSGFVSLSILGYLIRGHLLEFIIKPLNQTLFFTSPAGGFNFNIEIAIFFGFTASIPILLFEVLRFIEPAMPSRVKHSLLTVLVSSTILATIGIVFAYYICLPAALQFLAQYSSTEIKSLISVGEYFSFVTRYLIGFALLYQLPLAMILVNKIKKLKISELLKLERWVILISFVVAAIITPTPDVFNQLMMAVPIILLYQLSVIIIWLINRKH